MEYSLNGIVVHNGGLSGGHYISMGKKKSQWIRFDDSCCRKMKEKDILQKNAYILFYKRNK